MEVRHVDRGREFVKASDLWPSENTHAHESRGPPFIRSGAIAGVELSIFLALRAL